jgi:hypothetical protein
MAIENFDVFRDISKIIERDSKTSTYKFALLRGTIELVQDNSPFIRIADDRVHFPVGAMIERWMVYYYPILESDTPIPQIYGTSKLAFGPALQSVISFYRQRGGFSAFYNDVRNKGIPAELQTPFLDLAQRMRKTIVEMPMRYIGGAFANGHYSIYRKEAAARPWPSTAIDLRSMIACSGTFSIPLDYYHAFQVLGSFIGGQDSILFKWAQFSTDRGGELPLETVLHHVLRSPVMERDSEESKRLYRELLQEAGNVQCVWTGEVLQRYDVDHVIPFSVWKNNDLWNLLPSSGKVNNNKRDKIPSPGMLERSAERIGTYWERLEKAQPLRFRKELQVSLLGDRTGQDWQRDALVQLQHNCDYLINNRGFEPWHILVP